jgi:hypothetical protein
MSADNFFEKPPLPPAWAVGKIVVIADICKVFVPGFLDISQIEELCDKKIKNDKYELIKQCIPTSWRDKINKEAQRESYLRSAIMIPNWKKKLTDIRKFSTREFYRCLIAQRDVNVHFKDWERDYHDWLPGSVEWGKLLKNTYRRNTNNRAFDIRWRLLHFALPCHTKLQRWGTISYNTCDRCRPEYHAESIEHWFFFCRDSQRSVKFVISELDRLYVDAGPFRIAWELFIYGFESCGYRGNFDMGYQLLDIFMEAVFDSKMKLSKTGVFTESIHILKGKYHSLKEFITHKNKLNQ